MTITITLDRVLLGEVEQFLYYEARLLDAHRFDEWFALFTLDSSYWIPLEENQRDPFETSSILYDDHALLEIRVRQYKHARAHARRPFARTVHQVANVSVMEYEGLSVKVASTLVLVEYRNERQRVWGANVTHQLRRTDSGMRIAAKRVDLVNSEAELDGIAILF
jgi:3-phenylpropionate/cinnamic acid dioxygenase small subunit